MFKRKQQPAHECQITYDDVVGYLRDLEQVDYTKILKVVNTYREADKKVKKILNIKDEPVTAEFGLLDEDDILLGNFLDDDQDTPASKNQRETAKKATGGKKK